MAKRITPEHSSKLKLLLYGPPGSTKTRTAGTAAWDDRTAPALHLDIGGNTLTLADYRKYPDLVLVQELAEINPIYNWLLRGQNSNDAVAKSLELQPPYKTIIVDGVTDLQRSVMALASGQPKLDPGTIPNPMEIQHYNKVLRTMTNFARLFFLLDLHVIVTALERRQQDAAENIFYGPLLQGQSAMEVAGYAYAVGRMMHVERLQAGPKRQVEDAVKKQGDARAISLVKFMPSSSEMAKDQHGFGRPMFFNPTITMLLDAMEENRGKFGPEAPIRG